MFKNLTVKTRLFLLIAFMIVMMTAIGLIGLKGMSDSNEGLRTVYLDRTIPLDQLADIMDVTTDSIIQLQLMGLYDPRLEEHLLNAAPIARRTAQVKKNIDHIKKIWPEYMASYLTPEEKVMADEYAQLNEAFTTKGLLIALERYEKGIYAEANTVMLQTVNPKFTALMSKLDALKSLQVRVAKEEYEKASNDFSATRLLEMGWLITGMTLSLLMGFFLVRNLVKELGSEPSTVVELAANIAAGNLDNVISLKPGDEHSVLANMQHMQQQLLDRITKEANEKASALRIQKALDKAASNLMMADRNYNIIYTNESLTTMFQKAQGDIRTELPNFDASKLLGTNIDVFHKNPAYQRNLLDKLSTTSHSSLIVGGRHMDFIANPVFDDAGERIGTVVEWQDRTAEVKIENEIKAIVDAVKAGELDSRLNTADKSGFFQTLSIGIND